MDSKPLIAISFIDKNVKPHCSNDYLVNLPQQDIRIFIRPSNFEELQNLIHKEFSPRDKSPKYIFYYNGILPSGDSVELTDDLTFQKEISIVFAYYQKKPKNSDFLEFIDPKSYFSRDDLKIQIKEDDIPTLKINDEILFRRMKSVKISDDILEHKKNIENYITQPKDPIENIKKNINELILSSSKENIRKCVSNLDEVKGKMRDIWSKSSKCLNKLKNNNKKLDEMKETIRNVKKIPTKGKQIIEKNYLSPHQKKEEEKVLFKFKEETIKVEKDIKEIIGKEINIKKISIQNLSKKNYNSDLMAWLKDKNSDENINIKPGEENIEDENIINNQDLHYLKIKLFIDNPKENTGYKILVSLMNKETKKIISEKPLEILVKIKKEEKVLTKAEIDNILNDLRNEFDLFDLILKSDEVSKIIVEQKGNINNIKRIVKEKYLEEKKNKIKELMAELEKETNFSKLERNEVENKIIEYKFDEKEIKDWIKKQNPNPEPNPEPNPNPNPKNPIDEKKIEELYNYFNEKYYIEGICEKEEFKEKAIEYNYDIDKLDDYVQSLM